MFCCKCGAKVYHEAKYCHNCANALPDPTIDIEPLPKDTESKANSIAVRSASGSETRSNRKDLKCHKCGSSGGLKAWDFGLGKVVSTKRAWGETAISAALSAVTAPLIGYGMLRLPGKRTSFTVLRLRLVLCDACVRNRGGYSSHPFWNEANRLGYTEFFGPTELDKLEAVP
jgi:hypothetical protein